MEDRSLSITFESLQNTAGKVQDHSMKKEKDSEAKQKTGTRKERALALYYKYQEFVKYILFGLMTTVVSISVYAFCERGMHMNILIGNVFSWIFAVTFAFTTNKLFVFKSRTHGTGEFVAEIFRFYGGRVLTLGLEELILFIFITRMKLNSMGIKIMAQFIVFFVNYGISKLLVFRKKDKDEDSAAEN